MRIYLHGSGVETGAGPSPRRRRRLPSGLRLTGTAIAFTTLYGAPGALMPLLPVYQQRWALPASTLTLAFAVFAVGFLGALLTVGALSDHTGRRPALLGALAIALISNVIFLLAPDISWVIVGRTLQGFAAGAATPAFTALLVEIAPSDRKKLGTILGSVALTGGLALGSLLTGVALELTDRAGTVTFAALTGITICAIAVIALNRETVARTPGALKSLMPSVAIPVTARREFAAATPVIAATWMMSGLTGGLAPSMVDTVFLVHSGLLVGLSGFISPAASAVVGLISTRIGDRRAVVLGTWASIAGAAAIVTGATAGSLMLMLTGQAVCGGGFGSAFTAALGLIIPRAGTQQRAAVAAAIYLVSYSAFGVPVMLAGHIAGFVGLVPTIVGYSAIAALLAMAGLVAQRHLGRRRRPLVMP